MTDIWNLDALCRCCHADGVFKNLEEQYIIDNTVENYLHMILETLGVRIRPPPANASYSICDSCISQLRTACRFKRKVLDCEAKFKEYCKNELLSNAIKTEPEYLDDHIFDSDADEDLHVDYTRSLQKKSSESIHKTITKSPKKKSDENLQKYISKSLLKKRDDDTRQIISTIPQEISIKIPKTLKSLKKEVSDTKEVIEISIDAKPTIEKKPTRKRIKPKDKKPVKLKKPKEAESLVVIEKLEDGEELYSCKICGVYHDEPEYINKHISEHHGPGYRCFHCQEHFPNERRFKIHNAEVHFDKKPFVCSYCDKKIGSKISLAEHINSVHTKERYYQCDICQKIFHHKQVLRIHIRKHAGTFTKLICDQCGVGCNDKTNLKQHIMTVHEKIKLHECEICGKKFSAAKHLKVHIRIHTGERPFPCDGCEKKYHTREALKLHQKVHSNLGYKCKLCELVFETRGKHISHYKTHQVQKPFKCHLCDKAFAGKYSLNRHIFEHSGERPYVCIICKKDFKQKPQLVRHCQRFHNPNKPPVIKQKCDVCKRTVPNIEKHMLAHEHKPYACHLCEKRYPEQNALNRHVQRHSGVKPHTCNLCDKGFVQLRTLKKHKMKVHKLALKTEQEDHYDSLVNAFTIQNLKR